MDKAQTPQNRDLIEELMKRTPLPQFPHMSPYQTQECLSKATTNAQMIDCMYKALAQHGYWSDIGENFPGLYQKIQEARKVGVS